MVQMVGDLTVVELPAGSLQRVNQLVAPVKKTTTTGGGPARVVSETQGPAVVQRTVTTASATPGREGIHALRIDPRSGKKYVLAPGEKAKTWEREEAASAARISLQASLNIRIGRWLQTLLRWPSR